MRVLLKRDVNQVSADGILVLPSRGVETVLESLSGEAVSEGGVVAEANRDAVLDAINAAVGIRDVASVTRLGLLQDVEALADSLEPYAIGSWIGLHITGLGSVLDDSHAVREDRLADLSVGDAVVVGPRGPLPSFTNARGRIVSINDDRAEVELDAGDRDRIQRLTGTGVAKTQTFPLGCLEKVT